MRVPPWGGTPGGVPCQVGLSTLNWLLLSWHAPAQGLGVIGTHYRRDSNRAGPGTCRIPEGSCVWSAWADGTARWVLPPSTSCGSITEWYSIKRLKVLPMAESLQESAPAPVAEIARLQVVSALSMCISRTTLVCGCHSRSVGSVPAPYSFLPRPCVAASLETAGEPSKKAQRSARGEGRCDRCSTIDLSKRPSVFSP